MVVNSHRWFDVTLCDGEIFKDVIGYEGKYQISNLGRVLSFARKKPYIMKNHLDKDGYYRVSLRDISEKKRRQNIPVHRILAIAFISNPNGYPQIDHINTIRTDNSLSNLRWVTPQMNSTNKLSVIHRTNASIKMWSNVEFKERMRVICKLAKNTTEYKVKARELCRRKFKPVAQLDTNGNVVKVWECIADASKNTSASRRGIKMVCRGLMQHSGGYKWKFV
jgi:hypothetical protein